MGLNIKNERVCALAREAARRTGLNQTSVIEEALSRLLKEHDDLGDRERAARLATIQRIAAEFRAAGQPDDPPLTTDWLYDDETGLPA